MALHLAHALDLQAPPGTAGVKKWHIIAIPLALGLVFSQLGTTLTSDLPHFRAENGAQQFVVHGKPFLMLRQAPARTTELAGCISCPF